MARNQLAKRLRKNLTDAERSLWIHLRNRQIAGCKFRRQHPMGPFIVDFACPEKGLIIEIDGGQHIEAMEADLKRSEFLEREGYRILRFWNHEILQNEEAVLQRIIASIMKESPSPKPSPPLFAGEREIGLRK